MTTGKIMIAMSGGVDSSVAALLLSRQNRTLCGGTLLLCPGEADALSDAKDAQRVCERLGLPHYVFDLRDIFRREVIEVFAESYCRGETPNPCVDCNRSIKFTGLYEKAAPLGCDGLATGHYARIEQDRGAGRWLLRRACDPSKDQTYVLHVLGQDMLSRTLFPLGELTKREVRSIAAAADLSTASKSDSQDICFVKDGDYAGFLEQTMGILSPPGMFCSPEGALLGMHRGLIRYTLGQRRGLGVPADRRLFVLEKRIKENSVILGDEAALYSRRMAVSALNWVSSPPIAASLRAQIKSRYRQEAQPGWLHPTEDGGITVEFDQPQRALTPGQAAVFYDAESGDYVLGGGIIRSAREEIQ